MLATATLERALLVPLVVEEVLQCDQEERTETSARGCHGGKRAIRKNMGEELLGEILGFVNGVTAPARIAVKRKPVDSAEFHERFLGTLTGTQYYAPMRRLEPRRAMRGPIGRTGE